MDPKDFGRAILRRKASVITAVVVSLAFAFYGSATKQPVYATSCEVLFHPTAEDPTENDSRPFNPLGSQGDHARFIESGQNRVAAAKLMGIPATELGSVVLDVSSNNTGNLFTIAAADSGGPQPGPAQAKSYAKYRDNPGQRVADFCNNSMQAYIDYNLKEARQHYEGLLKRKQNLLNSLYEEVEHWQSQIDDTGSENVITLELIERNQALKSITEVREAITGIRDTLRDGIKGGGKVLEPAGAGANVESGRNKDLLMGLLMGLMLGIGFALVREYFDDTVKDKESTQRELGVPVLASLPAAEEFEGYGELSPSTMEAARALRTTLGSLGVPHDKSVLLVTSTLAKRRSTTLASLASAFAESGRSVLVLGSDLRGGRTHEAFGVANTVGLANVIRGQLPMEKAIRPAPGMEGVYVVPCGPVIGNPGELLSSEEMAMTLRRAQRWADVVLLDAPPVLAAADSSILGAFADGIVMVLSAGQTNKARAVEAKEQLVSAGGRVLGVVLTDCEETDRGDADFYSDDLGGMSGAWGAYESTSYGDYYGADAMAESPLGPRGTARRPASTKAAASRAGQRPTSSARTPSVPKNARTVNRTGAGRSNGSRPSGSRTGTSKAATSRTASTRAKPATSSRSSGSRTSAARKPAARKPAARTSSTARRATGGNGRTVRATITTTRSTRRR